MPKIVKRDMYVCSVCGRGYYVKKKAENCERDCKCTHIKTRYEIEIDSEYGSYYCIIKVVCVDCLKEFKDKQKSIDDWETDQVLLKKLYDLI